MKGRCLDAMPDSLQAIQWFQRALILDPFCTEAFEALVESNFFFSDAGRSWLSHMLSQARKVFPYDSPEFASARLLLDYYQCRVFSEDSPAGLRTATIPTATSMAIDSNLSPPHPTPTINNHHHTTGKGPLFMLIENRSLDTLASRIEHLFSLSRFSEVHRLLRPFFSKSPFPFQCAPPYLCSLIMLDLPQDLFLLAHAFLELYPREGCPLFLASAVTLSL